MTTTIEYALMAGASYISTRPEINRFPVPDGWVEKVIKRQALPSGFEATYFESQCSNEIVISFAGTDPGDITGDVAADLALAANYLGTEPNCELLGDGAQLNSLNDIKWKGSEQCPVVQG